MSNFEENGFPGIQKLWAPFVNEGCTLYLPSDAGYGPLDGYAMHRICRIFHPFVDVQIIPVHGQIEKFSKKNLILIGRLWKYGDGGLIPNVVSAEIEEKSQYRFLDDQRLLKVANGEMEVRIKEISEQRDFGAIRLISISDSVSVLQIVGIGVVGTLGATLAITDPSNDTFRKINQLVIEKNSSEETFIEFLVKSQWNPKTDRAMITPNEIRTTIWSDQNGESSPPSWPYIEFSLSHPANVFVKENKNSRGKLLISKSKNVYATLLSIARISEERSILFEDSKSFVTYEEILESNVVSSLVKAHFIREKHITQPFRNIIKDLQTQLKTTKWVRRFPNLMLQINLDAKQRQGSKVGLRLRAKTNQAEVDINKLAH